VRCCVAQRWLGGSGSQVKVDTHHVQRSDAVSDASIKIHTGTNQLLDRCRVAMPSRQHKRCACLGTLPRACAYACAHVQIREELGECAVRGHGRVFGMLVRAV
jgi:hypothetical protein